MITYCIRGVKTSWTYSRKKALRINLCIGNIAGVLLLPCVDDETEGRVVEGQVERNMLPIVPFPAKTLHGPKRSAYFFQKIDL